MTSLALPGAGAGAAFDVATAMCGARSSTRRELVRQDP